MFTKLQTVLSTVSSKQLMVAGVGAAAFGGFGLGYLSGRIHGRKKAAVIAVDETIVEEVKKEDVETTKE